MMFLDHMGTPLKNQNVENRASSCFKLAQIRPSTKISCPWDLWLRKTQTYKQDSCFISIDRFEQISRDLKHVSV